MVPAIFGGYQDNDFNNIFLVLQSLCSLLSGFRAVSLVFNVQVPLEVFKDRSHIQELLANDINVFGRSWADVASPWCREVLKRRLEVEHVGVHGQTGGGVDLLQDIERPQETRDTKILRGAGTSDQRRGLMKDIK